MFSGIVTAVGRIEALPKDFQGALAISHPDDWGNLQIGDSLAVNGCCLTVVRRDAGTAEVEVMPETLRRTNLGRLQEGDRVNLETALALGSRLGGHLVSGHIDATGEITALDPEGNAVWLTLRIPDAVGRFCVPQGSIAIDGCSLTLVSVQDLGSNCAQVRVSLIPHTVETTVAASYRPGTVVNLEADSIAKLVERLVQPHLTARASGSD
ncbi:MAG: riboflavin synthase [Candidatus Dormiibacterota bacterium]